ncbi:MAG: hypothetical protein M3275_05060 [Thermoproteota archaeon]|jgi:hypothetical protein|nr:hypothetical protein [Thermoproteota archaeon]
MSEFAYFRFMSYNMLTIEEQQHKDEIVTLTEQVLDAKGIECDSKISKISEEQLREILEEVRRLRKRNKKKMMIEEKGDGVEDSRQKEEEPDIIAMQ